MTIASSHTRRFLPMAINLQDKHCLVVGGGGVGTRKALTLGQAGAIVTVISPAVTVQLSKEIEAGRVRWLKDRFREEQLGTPFLVVGATDDEALNATVVRLAAERGSLVCDASSAERSQVIFGALLGGDGVTVAVFTDGRDPAKARRTRDEIAGLMAERHQSPQDSESG